MNRLGICRGCGVYARVDENERCPVCAETAPPSGRTESGRDDSRLVLVSIAAAAMVFGTLGVIFLSRGCGH
jgi:hypothetical protein